jgi:hypothetical protein
VIEASFQRVLSKAEALPESAGVVGWLTLGGEVGVAVVPVGEPVSVPGWASELAVGPQAASEKINRAVIRPIIGLVIFSIFFLQVSNAIYHLSAGYHC